MLQLIAQDQTLTEERMERLAEFSHLNKNVYKERRFATEAKFPKSPATAAAVQGQCWCLMTTLPHDFPCQNQLEQFAIILSDSHILEHRTRCCSSSGVRELHFTECLLSEYLSGNLQLFESRKKLTWILSNLLISYPD